MKPSFRKGCALVLIAFTSCARVQGGTHDSTTAAAAETHRPTLTGKERLGPKWTDEQRIDNCHVPIAKRGNKTRPTACPDSPSS